MSGSTSTALQLLSLQTALGSDALLPVSFHAEESLSTPYSVTVEAVSDQANIDPNSVLFQPACLTVMYGSGDPRILHGMVRSFVASGDPSRDQYTYTLTFVPKLWFMRQTADCRIFTNKTIADIIKAICGDAGQTVSVTTTLDTDPRLYVTQYNESDFAFFSRLVEEAGCYYYFAHTSSDHTLTIIDVNSSFPASPSLPAVAIAESGQATDVLTAWHKVGSTAYGTYQLLDYDLTKPTTLPTATKNTVLSTSGASTRSVFQWPGLGYTNDDVTRRAGFMIEAAEAEAALVEALGSNPSVMPGAKFTIKADPYTGAKNVDYIVRSVSSSGHDQTWITSGGGSDFSNRIVAFPAATQWRERFSTPRPVMAGIHSAVVLGDSGEEIHADQYCRIKVQFFWDHRQDVTADNGIWVRVIQPWAGNTWGIQYLPRVGDEVAVSFLDGDPDRPVVVGSMYNANQMPPFAIPGEQTKSGLRTRSTTGGSSSTFSEFSIDDKAGSEMVFLHAEKDMFTEIENNDTLTVGNDQTVTIKHDQTIEVDNNRSLLVKKQETIEIDDSQTITVKNGRTTTVNASGDSLTVKDGGITVTASQSDITVEASAGSITIKAMNSIKLVVGGNSIEINQQGVTVKGTQISIQGQAQVDVKGPMTTVNGDATLTLKGGAVMIN